MDTGCTYTSNKICFELNWMSNILSLYLSAYVNPVACFKAKNYDPKVEDSTVFCHFEIHNIGVMLRKMIISVYSLNDLHRKTQLFEHFFLLQKAFWAGLDYRNRGIFVS